MLGELYLLIYNHIRVTIGVKCGFVSERFRQLPYCIDFAGSNSGRDVLTFFCILSYLPTHWIERYQGIRQSQISSTDGAVSDPATGHIVNSNYNPVSIDWVQC